MPTVLLFVLLTGWLVVLSVVEFVADTIGLSDVIVVDVVDLDIVLLSDVVVC